MIEDEKAKQEKRFRSHWKLNMLCAIVIIVAATVFFLRNDTGGEALSWDDQALTLTLSEEMVYTIPYADIVRVELREDADLGVCLSGSDTEKSRYGVWKNDQVGEYVLYVGRSVSPVIQISTAGEDYWIALESEDATTEFYRAFADMLEDGGYQIQWIPQKDQIQ